VLLSRYIPVVGRLLYTVTLAWLYAYYCFDYKWGLGGWSLDQRLHHFETHWAYFAGFGTPCTLAASLLPGLVGEGVMAALFPLVRPSIWSFAGGYMQPAVPRLGYLTVASDTSSARGQFVLVAVGTDVDDAKASVWPPLGIPIFRFAASQTTVLLGVFI
jgi:hypothetical protein